MKSVGIKVLKNKLSEYIRLAALGETILICDRDNVVAELRPVSATRSLEVADAVLADLIREGMVTPALISRGAPPDGDGTQSLQEVLADLDGDRSER